MVRELLNSAETLQVVEHFVVELTTLVMIYWPWETKPGVDVLQLQISGMPSPGVILRSKCFHCKAIQDALAAWDRMAIMLDFVTHAHQWRSYPAGGISAHCTRALELNCMILLVIH